VLLSIKSFECSKMTSVLTSTSIETSFPANVDAENNDPVSPTASATKKSNAKRKSASLPSETVEYLKAWMMSPEHIAHPYPTEQEKVDIMKDTKIELKQLTNWFVNNRKRYWKPRVEARLQQQAQAAQAAVQAHAAVVAAVSAANLLPQQQQVVAASSPGPRTANLVSPTVAGFKYASQSTLSSQASNPPIITYNSSSSHSPSLQHQSFSSSSLSFAAQIVEQSRKSIATVQATSTAGAVNQSAAFSSSVASVSASEGESEMSDSGSTSDDASSDGTTILGTDLKFIDLKMKKKFFKTRTSSVSLTPLSPEVPRQTMNMRTNYTRNVSFCSLDKISLDVASTSSPQECQATTSSTGSKKRPLVADNDNELPHVVATSDSESNHIPERKRFRTVSVDVWRKKCQDANHVYDEALPSLEEASRLFGFTSA
jgi:hypothetical protein